MVKNSAKTNLIKMKVRTLIAKGRVYHLAKLLAYTSGRERRIDANSIKHPAVSAIFPSHTGAKMV